MTKSCSVPPPTWKGWRALLLMLTAPLLCKVTTALIAIVSVVLLPDEISEKGQEDMLADYSVRLIPSSCDDVGYAFVWTVLSVISIVLLYGTALVNLLFLLRPHQCAHDLCRCHVIQDITIQYLTYCGYGKTNCDRQCVSIPMSRLIATLSAVLLLLSAKEVETDTRPLLECDNLAIEKWSHSHACLMCHETLSTVHGRLTSGMIISKSKHLHVHFGNNYCSQPLDDTVVIKYLVCFIHRWRTKCAAVVFKLLMLSGDIETNPGPTGKLTLKNVRSLLYCVRAKWKNIGIQLEVDIGTLNAIEKRCRSDPDDCLPEMLDYWLKQVTPSPSWSSLAEALESEPIGEGHLAEQLREKYCTECEAQTEGLAVADTHDSGSRCTTKYSEYLKALYTGSTHITDNKWPPTPPTKYVNLHCVDGRAVASSYEDKELADYMYNNGFFSFRGGMNKSLITIEQVARKVKASDLLSKKVYPKVVLVRGAPGVGKTTLSWELCHRWAKGELLQDYSLVVLLRLRDRSAREAKELVDLFPHPKKSTSEAVVDDILESNGSGVLILLEGFDELPGAMRIQHSIYSDLMDGKLLPSATVLVTSRPWAVGDFEWKYKARISLWIEILGFSEQQIDDYLVSYSNGDHKLLAELRRYLSLNPPIHAAMYIPLNAVIVCELYKEQQQGEQDCVIPSTMTELYTIFSRNLLLRYLFDQGERPGFKKITEFKDFPEKIYQKFLRLCEVAYEGITKKEIVFSDLPDKFDSLGFMQSVVELHISSGISVSYNFLHLSMQEFLAAYHMSLHPECVQQGVTSSIESTTVVKFLAGTTKLQCAFFSQLLQRLPTFNPEQKMDVQVERVSQLKRIHNVASMNVWIPDISIVTLSSCLVNYYTGVRCSTFLKASDTYCSWFFESQNVNKLNECFGSKTALIQITSDMTPMDCFAAGWCIGNSSCTWKFCFYSDIQLSLDCMQMLHAGIKHSSHQKRKFCDLCIGEGVMNSDPDTVREIFELLDSNFDVIKVNYSCCCYTREHTKKGDQCNHLSSLIKKSKHLKELELVSVEFPHVCIAMQSVFEDMKTLQLEAVLLRYCKLHNSIVSIVKEIASLKVLDLSGSRFIGISGSRFVRIMRSQTGTCEQLAELLKRNKTLQSLILYGCHFTEEGTTALFHVFTSNQNTTLQTLNVSDNNYSTKELEKMLVSNASLQSVEVTVTLVDNPADPWHSDFYLRHATDDVRVDEEERAAKFNSTPGMVAYVRKKDTVESVCGRIVSALTKNATLKYIGINTLFSEWLSKALSKCDHYDKVEGRIKIIQSKNPMYY